MEKIVNPIVKNNNSIFVIKPYLSNGVWQFDYPSKNIQHEAFVAGADTLLDKICQGKNKCTILFSHIPFPGHKLSLEYVEGNVTTGTVYHCKELDQQLWLCPTLGAFYEESPIKLYIDYKL